MYAKFIYKTGDVKGSAYEKMKAKDIYSVELPDNAINQEELQNELNVLYTHIEEEMLLDNVKKNNLSELKKYEAYYAGVFIDEQRNCVVADISDLTEEKKEMFAELFGNVKCLEFREP